MEINVSSMSKKFSKCLLICCYDQRRTSLQEMKRAVLLPALQASFSSKGDSILDYPSTTKLAMIQTDVPQSHPNLGLGIETQSKPAVYCLSEIVWEINRK